MKIETMLRAFSEVQRRYDRNRSWRIFWGIMRRYIRLQAENARLKADVAFWKLEAQRGEGDDE